MTPEPLSLWDRLFNRYRKEFFQRGEEQWQRNCYGYPISGSEFKRSWVEYKVIDRVTGGYTIERDYLN